ncbi:MAG TPA: hypothetical protein VK087_01880 [Tissierellaceae bacterium]|nr:hypothetical protein [Tissierellaceae bacterium]
MKIKRNMLTVLLIALMASLLLVACDTNNDSGTDIDDNGPGVENNDQDVEDDQNLDEDENLDEDGNLEDDEGLEDDLDGDLDEDLDLENDEDMEDDNMDTDNID